MTKQKTQRFSISLWALVQTATVLAGCGDDQPGQLQEDDPASIGAVGAGVTVNASADPRTWVAFDTAPPGTPAAVAIDRAQSSTARTVLNVSLHGLWTQIRKGPDGRDYTEIEAPGLGTLGQPGAPALPALRADLAILTSAQDATLAAFTATDMRTLTGVLAWPQPLPERDQAATSAPGSRPETFQIDPAIYSSTEPYPVPWARSLHPRRPKLGSIDGTTLEITPVHWNPADGTLTVAARAQFVFTHSGTVPKMAGITKDRAHDAADKFVNWSIVSPVVVVDVARFSGRFLFIYPPGYREELLPLITQKQIRGFSVTEMTTGMTGTSCASIRAAINTWYAGGSLFSDHYALLVGDVNQIPTCTAPTGAPSDDLYGTTDGDNLDKEVHVGRLSVDSETDAADQVEKILGYEDDPDPFFNYGKVLLVAHMQDAPGKYVGAQESVRTAPYYTVAPSFSTLYGNDPNVTDADVVAAINAGQGIVAYRGHGDVGEWWSWNTHGESFLNSDVVSVANVPTEVPIVWSIACLNNNLATSDSIGETWMKTPGSRAVAHYGATEPSYTVPNHELDRRLFRAVFGLGRTRHASAIEYGEDQMVAAYGGSGEENAWMYLLLGDPELRIRRGAALKLSLRVPSEIQLACSTGPCPPISISLSDPSGLPVSGALVSIWKDGEVFDNHYTDASGVASFTVNARSPGMLYAAIRTEAGDSVATRAIPVR
jgi:hypothetical protein